MKENLYHHWEEEVTETALDYKPVTLVKNWLNRVWWNRLARAIHQPEAKGWRLIDQILEKKR